MGSVLSIGTLWLDSLTEGRVDAQSFSNRRSDMGMFQAKKGGEPPCFLFPNLLFPTQETKEEPARTQVADLASATGLPEIDFVDPRLLGEEGEPGIVCDTDKALHLGPRLSSIFTPHAS